MSVSFSSQRWQRVQDLFDEVVDLPAEARAARIDEACQDDPEVRREVESLLAAYDQADERLRDVDQLVHIPSELPAVAPSRTGTRVAHYHIQEKLGGGGMGVVYKARDTRLDRSVALKFLPPHLSANQEAKGRLIHEAKAASALDHPNIAVVHEIGETQQGQLFIVMAYYAGGTLKKKIAQGLLPIDDAVALARQVAQGLSKTHAAGIVHRDIKPANVMVTDQGLVKLVDFGIAKVAAQTGLTKTGSTVGTVSYMSPEQARGEAVDHRTDLWALGVVLYEMLTGERPFKGEYEQAVIYSLLHTDPEPITALRPDIPPALEAIVDQALAKDLDERYQHVDEMLGDLHALSKQPGAEPIPPVRARRRRKPSPPNHLKRLLIPLAAVLGLAVAFMVLLPILREEPVISSPIPIAVMPFENKTGDPSYDYLREAIPNLLITNLDHSKYLNLMTWERMQDLLKVIGKDDLALVDLDKDTAFELCKREGIDAIVVGSFTKAGDWFATEIQVLDVQTKSSLLSTNAKGEGLGSIIQSQIDDLSEAISQSVIVPSGTVKQERFNAANITTNSMEAYRYYLEGVKNYHQFLQARGKASVQKAVELDSTFAMAYYYLAKFNLREGIQKAAKAAIEKAMTYASKATEKEGLYIKMDYAEMVERDAEKALSMNKELVRKYPKEKEAHFFLSRKYGGADQTHEAIDASNRAKELDPNWGIVYNRLGYLYARIGEFEKAEEHLLKYAALNPEESNPFDSLGELYFIIGRLDDALINYELSGELAQELSFLWVQGLLRPAYIYATKEEYAEAFQQYDQVFARIEMDSLWNERAPVLAAGIYRSKGLLDFYVGRYQEALRRMREAITFTSKAGAGLFEAEAQERMAFVYAEMGAFAEAEREVQTALKTRLRTSPQNSLQWRLFHQCFSGFIDVKAGRVGSAKAKLQAVQEMLPKVNVPERRQEEIYSYWAGLLEGEIALAEGLADEAIERFQKVDPPDPFYVGMRYWYEYRVPLMRDGLARAYYAAGDLDKAIAEYRRLIVFDPNGKERFLISPKYHYRLAKLYQEKGATGLAVQEYEHFLDIWKEADDSLPELLDAKKQLLALEGTRK